MTDEAGSRSGPSPARPEGYVDTVVTYLEMTTPPSGAAATLPPGIEIRHARRPTIAFYRHLYDTVGAPWMWTERRVLGHEALAAILSDPRVEVNVLWMDGVPGGYAELDHREPFEAELAYLGLMPEVVGRRLGRLLLDWAIRHAWRAPIRRLWVHTCDLDHPGALDLYQSAGFRIYDRRPDRVATVPELVLPRHKRAR